MNFLKRFSFSDLKKKIKIFIFLYVKDIIEKKKKNKILKFFLGFFSIFFEFAVFFKNLLFDLKILKSKKVKPIVISVGNIVAGGTGKTPFIILLAKKLIPKYKVAILSRGYKSKFENRGLLVDQNSNFTAQEIGDEPLFLKHRLKKATIFIGKNKLKSAKRAGDLNFDIVLIDDGFQYRKIKKDIEIVIINASDPFGYNRFLPKGYLRDSLKSLKRANFVVINNADEKTTHLEKKIKRYTDASIFQTIVVPNNFYDLSKKKKEIEKNSKVALFCAIAYPAYFFNTIKKMGFDIVNFSTFLDHEKFSLNKLKEFIQKSKAKKAKYVLITEKDAVKLDANLKMDLPIFYLETSLKISSDNLNFISLVEKIMKLVNN